MPKSMVQILPNNKCEVEREREIEIGRETGEKKIIVTSTWVLPCKLLAQ